MIMDAGFFTAGFLLGSIPFGLVLCKLFGYGDIRKIGSGNIGATNVLRTGNKPLALATLILDIGKGAAAVLIIGTLFNHSDITLLLTGLGAILGHIFSPWLGFKGGKGVATTIGTILALNFPLGLMMCAIWLMTAGVTKISSLAALVAFALSPIIALTGFGSISLAIFCAAIAVLISWRHKDNIKRILKGEESKIGLKK